MTDTPDDRFGTLLYENEYGYFYVNDNTLMYEKKMKEYDTHGINIDDISRVVCCIPKDGSEMTYVAFDKNGKPFMDWKDPYSFEIWTKLYKMDLAEKNDILKMAKDMKETDKETI